MRRCHVDFLILHNRPADASEMNYGIFCPAAIGHLNPTCSLAFELQRRGHSVTLFGVADALAKVKHHRLNLVQIGADEFPPGEMDSAWKKLGQLTGRQGLKFTIDLFKRESQMLFCEAPGLIKAANINFLIVDQIANAIATVADYLQIPYVTVCNAMLLHRELSVPPFFTHWQYSKSSATAKFSFSRLRNRLGYSLLNFASSELRDVIVDQRNEWGLPPYDSYDAPYSKLAQIIQLPELFDFPRKKLPDQAHYIGQLMESSGIEPVGFDLPAFPFEKLNEKTLIYASLGTLQNQKPEIFRCIAKACDGLDVQLVISLGSPNAQLLDLPGNPIVVPFAPHQKLIEMADLVVTHAGMNTVLTALSCGVPMVAIPITNEQPGIAARVEASKVGRTIKLSRLSASKLRKVIVEVLGNPSFRAQSRRMQQHLKDSGGVERAADIIDEVAQTGQPVVSRRFRSTAAGVA